SSLAFQNQANTLATSGAGLTLTASGSLVVCNLTSGGDVNLTAGSSFGGISARGISAGGNISMRANSAIAGSGFITQTGDAVGLAINVVGGGGVTVDAVRGTSASVTCA